VKDVVIGQFEIRLPDIDKEPFDANGYVKLPITGDGTFDFKKLGLKPQIDMET